jgi:hypothetical protein
LKRFAEPGAFILAGVVTLIGCAGSASKHSEAPAHVPPLHGGPLTDFVPAAGLRWMVAGRPRELAQNTEFAEAVGRLLPEARLSAYAQSTGVDLRTLPNGLIAGFDYATLYMAEMRKGDELVEQRFGARLLHDATLESKHPKLRRLSGVVGRTPETLLVARGHWVALAVGDPSPTRVAEGFALRRLRRSPPALRGSALSTLPAHLEQAPLRFYAPGPFVGEWARAARGLLARSFAIGFAAKPAAGRTLDACVVLAGDFGDLGAEAEPRLRGAWEDLAESSTGTLLGLRQAASASRVRASAEQLELCVALSLAEITRGLHAAVSADAWELLDVPKPQNPDKSHLPVQKR